MLCGLATHFDKSIYSHHPPTHHTVRISKRDFQGDRDDNFDFFFSNVLLEPAYLHSIWILSIPPPFTTDGGKTLAVGFAWLTLRQTGVCRFPLQRHLRQSVFTKRDGSRANGGGARICSWNVTNCVGATVVDNLFTWWNSMLPRQCRTNQICKSPRAGSPPLKAFWGIQAERCQVGKCLEWGRAMRAYRPRTSNASVCIYFSMFQEM